MIKKVFRYFSLEKPQLGQSGVVKEIALFTGVVAGAAGQWAFAAVKADSYHFPSLILGLIASFVTFPAIYYNAGLDKAEFSFVKWCVAFQNGFFWPTLLQQIGETIGKH